MHNHEPQAAAVHRRDTTNLGMLAHIKCLTKPALFSDHQQGTHNLVKNYGNSGWLGDLRFSFDLETDSVKLSDPHFLSTSIKQGSMYTGHSNGSIMCLTINSIQNAYPILLKIKAIKL